MSAQERFRDIGSAPQPAQPADSWAAPISEMPIRIGKTVIPGRPGVLVEIFTMTIGTETIQLLPLKNWVQLDIYKWRTRGILPRTPAGLEVAWDHVKVAGETVSPWDAEACSKLEKAFSEWLALERQNLEKAKEKAQASSVQAPPTRPDEDVVHFELDVGNAAQPRLKCVEGNQTVKVVALNQQGLNALIQEGLMRKPQSLKVGALHDWVELDGELFRFKQEPSAASALEKALNENYIVAGEPAASQDVVVFPNPASPTGFDVQFPASPNGIIENRRRHLNEETVQLLQDPERCHVLRKGIVAKLAPPDLIFKLKTPDGGECYLEPGPDTRVSVTGERGETTTIDLSQPLNLLNLGARELAAALNHPAINRRARLAQTATSEHDQV